MTSDEALILADGLMDGAVLTPQIQTWLQSLPHGITLSCRACGERGRPVLMFLHGFPEGAFVWDGLMQHFAQDEHGGYRCVAPNLRGFEQSSAPPEVKDYRAKHLIQDILALMETECAAQPLAALVAHDWGGALAWGLANQRPDRLRQLVILNAPHPGTFLHALQHNPAQQAASAYMNFLVQPDAAAQLAANDHARLLAFLTGSDSSLPSLSATPDAFVQPDWLSADVKAQYRQVWQHGLQGGLNYYRASPLRPMTATDPGASAVQLPDAALRIEVPTLVLWGQDDVALLPCLTDGLAQHVPQLKLVPIAQASHWVVHEQPQRVIAEIMAFLQPPGGAAPPTSPAQ